MVRAVVAIAFVWMAQLGLACEYKPVMTDADLDACRNEKAAAPPKQTHAPPPEPKREWTSADEEAFRQKQLAELARLEAARAEAQRAAQAPERPAIGMSADEAMQTEWAKHWCGQAKKNRTTSRFGVREQWVCTDYNYMYFDNGKLTSIQEH